jgi:hypothetical protein
MQLVGELGDVPGHAHSLIYLAHETDWRSLFILAVNNVATDSVIKRSEMVAEYHLLYSTAALMSVNSIHQKMSTKQPRRMHIFDQIHHRKILAYSCVQWAFIHATA